MKHAKQQPDIEQDFVTHTPRNNLNMAVCSAGEGSS